MAYKHILKRQCQWRLGAFIVIALVIFSAVVLAEGDPKPSSATPSAASVQGKKSAVLEAKATKRSRSKFQEEYRLKKGDRILITIYPEDEYVRGGESLITEDGDVRIHTLGKVNVADKTIVEAERLITEALKDYFVDPAVVIELVESEEMSLVILGEVRKPGSYSFPMGSNQFTLMEAIALAGGFSDIANIKKITIARKDETGKVHKTKVNAEKILQGKDEDVELQPSDIVSVPQSLF